MSEDECVGLWIHLMSFLLQGVITNISLCFPSRKRVHQKQGNKKWEEGQVGR